MLEEEAEAKRLLAEAKAIGDLYGVNVAARIAVSRRTSSRGGSAGCFGFVSRQTLETRKSRGY